MLRSDLVPANLVLFDRPDPANLDVLRAVTATVELPSPRRGVRVLGRDGRPIVRLYEALGVAAAHLEPAERARLGDQPGVEVVPNEVRHAPPHRVHDDIPVAWGVEATGADRWAGPDGDGVTVAVLDTGVDPAHPDLTHHFSGGVGLESFVPGSSPVDQHGHGTHSCGVIGARDTLDLRYGVAPEVTLLSGKVLSDEGAGTDAWVLDGIAWAVGLGARIISLGLATGRDVDAPYALVYERVARLLLDQPGVLLFAAAGGSSSRPHFVAAVGNPGACPSVAAVAAVDRRLEIAPFSSRQLDGAEVDLAGPGVSVVSSWPGGRLRMLSGTATAPPHAAAIAALVWSRRPDLTAREVLGYLRGTARPLPDHADTGAGLVQVSAEIPD